MVKKEISSKKQKLSLKIRFRSLIAGIKKQYRLKKKNFIHYLNSDEFQIPKNSLLNMFLNGVLFAIGLTYFIGFQWKIIFITGCGWWIFKREILPEVRKLISSINFINIRK